MSARSKTRSSSAVVATGRCDAERAGGLSGFGVGVSVESSHASGSVPEAQCVFNSSHYGVEHNYAEESRAYNRLAHEGVIAVDACIETPTPGDGFCLARFIS
jgi:hypothetical protein